MAEHFLCQKQLAKRWGMSHRTLESWRYRGIGLPYLKLGGRIAYRISDIEAYEARQTHQAMDPFAAHGFVYEDIRLPSGDGRRC